MAAAGWLLQEEAAYKLLKVVRQQVGKGGIPYIATHDGRTIRYPDPDIKVAPRASADIKLSSWSVDMLPVLCSVRT